MKRFRRSRWRELLTIAVVLLLAALRLLSGDPVGESPSGSARGLQPGMYRVERVVDGDTLLLSEGKTRIRLQGVDTPETVKVDARVEPWGPEASAFTKAFVARADGSVRVEIDGEPLDQHGRHLAFIWAGDRMLNEALVSNGLARAMLQYDFSERKKNILRRAQRDARRKQVGLWSAN